MNNIGKPKLLFSLFNFIWKKYFGAMVNNSKKKCKINGCSGSLSGSVFKQVESFNKKLLKIPICDEIIIFLIIHGLGFHVSQCEENDGLERSKSINHSTITCAIFSFVNYIFRKILFEFFHLLPNWVPMLFQPFFLPRN